MELIFKKWLLLHIINLFHQPNEQINCMSKVVIQPSYSVVGATQEMADI